MRINIELDEDLVAEAQRVTGLRTNRGLIDHALRELVRRRQQRRLLELRGRVKWEGNLSKIRRHERDWSILPRRSGFRA